MKLRLKFTAKILIPYLIMVSLFLGLFISEFGTGHTFVLLFSAIGFLITIAAAIINIYWLKRPLNSINNLIRQLNKGVLPENSKLRARDEIGDLERELTLHIEYQKEIVEFARSLEEGNFSQKLELLGEEDQLRISLLSLRDSLEKAREEGEKRREDDEHRTWSAHGLARFSGLLRETEDNLENMAVSLVRELVNYTVADVGGLFIIDTIKGVEEEEKVLKLIGSYAFDRQKFVTRQFGIGEGLVGRAAMEMDLVYITDIPGDYLKIRSGLGEQKPLALLIVPVMLDSEVLAVLELASLEDFPSYQIDFIKALNETIAFTLTRIGINNRAEKLPHHSGNQSGD